jgi:hypothetical protein
MGGRVQFAAVAALAVAAAVAASGVSSADDGGVRGAAREAGSGMATGVFRRGPISGIAVAERTRVRRARLFVVVEALPVKRAYLVFDTKPCAEAVERPDVVLGIIMANTEGDFHFRSSRVRLRQRLAATRSVRIYDRRDSGESRQLACTRAIISDKATPKL